MYSSVARDDTTELHTWKLLREGTLNVLTIIKRWQLCDTVPVSANTVAVIILQGNKCIEPTPCTLETYTTSSVKYNSLNLGEKKSVQ